MKKEYKTSADGVVRLIRSSEVELISASNKALKPTEEGLARHGLAYDLDPSRPEDPVFFDERGTRKAWTINTVAAYVEELEAEPTDLLVMRDDLNWVWAWCIQYLGSLGRSSLREETGASLRALTREIEELRKQNKAQQDALLRLMELVTTTAPSDKQHDALLSAMALIGYDGPAADEEPTNTKVVRVDEPPESVGPFTDLGPITSMNLSPPMMSADLFPSIMSTIRIPAAELVQVTYDQEVTPGARVLIQLLGHTGYLVLMTNGVRETFTFDGPGNTLLVRTQDRWEIQWPR